MALARSREGIALREAGDLEAAEWIFRSLTRDYPDKAYGWQELGVLHAQRGEAEEALRCFHQAIRSEPDDVLPRRHCALHLLALGRGDDGDRVLASHPQANEAARRQVRVLRQFLAYLGQWPERDALAMANAYETGGRFHGAGVVEAQLFAAVEQARPFSLVRIGDGEGAWLRLDEQDEQRHPDLYERNRREFVKLWFAQDQLHDDPAFQALSQPMCEAFRNATILGMPSSLRVAHEYRLKSLRGISSTVNVLRWHARDIAGRDAHLCSQDIHLELQHAGFYRRLLDTGCDLNVITCHPGLPRLIGERTGAQVRAMHLVPEEKGFSDVIGRNGIEHAHFPTVYGNVLDAIDQPSCRGPVWLVAAGMLGKLYCERIRQRGGIALDVGSVVDGWLGKVTRPTLRHIERFTL